MAEDVLGHDATRSEPVVGYESLKEVMSLFHSAFPDAQYPLYDILADGDKVVARWGIQGVQHGAFMGFPPSGKPVNVNGIIIYRLKNQKIVEYWGSFDMLGLLRQLGAAP